MELSDKELLNFAIENGIIDVSDIQQKIEMNERNRYIENHNYSIWQSKDGKFYTYLPDEKYSRGKRLIKRTTEQALNDAIVQFYKEQENEPYIEDAFSPRSHRPQRAPGDNDNPPAFPVFGFPIPR